MGVTKDENTYSNILKRIFSFGGVQLFNIIVTLVRGKFVALLLGAEGMGLSSLFTSSTGTVQQFAGLGLNLALVKEIASSKDDESRIAHAVAVAIRLIFITSGLGAIICFCLSPLLSLWTFGNYDYVISFMMLAAGVALSVGGAGYLSLLQGMGEVKRLSKASLVGGLAGLFCGVPLYYLFGLNGIVPAIVIMSMAVFIFYYFSFKKSVEVDKVRFSWSSHKPMVKRLISLGLILMSGSLVGTFTNYAINIFIRAFGSIDDVGLFQGANSLTNQYIGVIFSALALDYFPRLSAVANDASKLKEVVNRQAEIVILIATPLVLLLILTTPLVIDILLTEEFLKITPLMRWLGLGVLIQAISFPLSYLFIAKENRKIYIWVEIVFTNVMWIVCSTVFYYFFSLVGLGISLVARSAIDVIVTYVICAKVYSFAYMRETLYSVIICTVMGISGFLFTLLPGNQYYFWLPPLVLISVIYSFIKLRKGVRLKKEKV